MEPDRASLEREPRSQSRHWLGFLISGGLAFVVDAAILEIGVRMLDAHPLIARGFAIAVAMVVGWLAHRTFTFAVATAPSRNEFARYAAAGLTSAAINYGIFALAFILLPTMHRLVALVLSSAGAMIFSYLSMKYVVFRGG